MRGITRTLVVTVATAVPAVVVWIWFGRANPPQHDLSDIATGFLQFGCSALAALAGLVIALAVTHHRGGRG